MVLSHKLKILQINLRRARATTLELAKVIDEYNCDIVCTQEPYTYLDKSKNTYQIPTIGNSRLIQACISQPCKAALIICKKEINVVGLYQFSDDCQSAAEINIPGEAPFYVMSAYFPPSEEINAFNTRIVKLKDFIRMYQRKKVVICMDSNAGSPIWYSSTRDERGVIIENLITEFDLTVLNEPGSLATFSSERGQSNIDVSIATESVLRHVSNWMVHEDAIDSDHRLISFDISVGASTETSSKEIRYDLKSMNADTVVAEATKMIAELERALVWRPGIEHIETRAQLITMGLKMVCDKSLKVLTQRKSKHASWWTAKIEKLRKTFRQTRRMYRRARGDLDRQVWKVRCEYDRCVLIHEVNITRDKSWETFVDKELSQNPWGAIYKMSSNKMKAKHIPSTLRKSDGTYTTNLENTLAYTLEVLIPDDLVLHDSPHHQYIRSISSMMKGKTQENRNFDRQELDKIIAGLKAGKALGPDGIPAEIVKVCYPAIREHLYGLFQDCLNAGYFPKAWREGCIHTIPKSSFGKDPTNPKSLRPVTLLNTLAKILEKVIKNQIYRDLPPTEVHSLKQHGFITGRSTITAMQAVLESNNQHQKFKYGLMILVDISGAFDNLWWPAFIMKLVLRGFSASTVEIIKSYLSEREVSLKSGSICVKKTLTRGCPQGSVLGPIMWNLFLDDLLESHLPTAVEMVAYADDVAILVYGNSRTELESKSNQILYKVQDWCSRNKMKLAEDKTNYMMLKGLLKRNPLIKINGKSIKRVQSAVYLGVTFSEGLLFSNHVKATTEKALAILNRLRFYTKKRWGNPTDSYKTIYNLAIIPIIEYGVAVWGNCITQVHNRRKIMSVYGSCTRLIMGSYASVSNEAAGVIAKQPPLDLILLERKARFEIVRNGSALFCDVRLPDDPQQHMTETKRSLRRLTMAKWQERWDCSEKGRTTYGFIPNIRNYIDTDLTFTRESVQLITGHGNFGAHLLRIGKSINGLCELCHSLDDSIHRLTTCGRYEDARLNLINIHNWDGDDLPSLLDLMAEFPHHFEEFITEAGQEA